MDPIREIRETENSKPEDIDETDLLEPQNDNSNYFDCYKNYGLPEVHSHEMERDYKHKVLKYLNLGHFQMVSFDNKSDVKTIDMFPKAEENENFDKIGLLTLIAYCLPSFGKMSCIVLLNVHATLFYETIGASLIYMSFFVSLTRGIEIMVKPIVAYYSDSLKSTFGRRKPFLLAGCGFYALFLILLFGPPTMKTSSRNISIWFGVFYVFFFIAESVTNVPYLALGPELSKNSKQRERLYFCFYVFQYIGVLFVAACPVILNKLLYECDCGYCYDIWFSDVDLCVENCQIMCSLKSNAKALSYLSLGIGIFFVLSMVLLCFTVKEKSESFNSNALEFIPSLYELINNKAFLSLIIPWILDVTIMTIFSTMLPFFLNVIINPQHYCVINKIPLDKLECSVNYYLGLSISIFFICCIFSCGLWHYLVSKFGKRKCWQTFSLLCVIPFTLYLLCDEGTSKMLITAAILTAIPTGGAYLNDVMVSDTIDYDEFFTGRRNEGIFTMCSAFIPKFVSLFAQALPLSLLSIIGFQPTENGKAMTQPEQVKIYIKVFFSIIPIIISITSFYFKLKYPIKNDGVMFQIKQGIDKQKDSIEDLKTEEYDYYKLEDPVYRRKVVNLILKNEEQVKLKSLSEHFSNVKDLCLIYNEKTFSLKSRVLSILISSALLFLVGLVTLCFTFDFLSSQKFSFIPISALFLISFCIVLFFIYFMKLKKLNKLINKEIEMDKKFFRLIIYQKVINEGPDENSYKNKKIK